MTVLRHRRFAAIWSTSVASNIGTMMQTVGATWLMASMSPSAEMVALVVVANSLPIPALGLLAGAVADLYDRRNVLIGAQLGRLIVSILLAGLAIAGLVTPWILLGATFLLGCGVAMNQPAWHAAVGDMVPREDVPDAVALNSVGFNVGRTAGPAIGGMVVALAGSAVCFVVNALSNVGLLIALITWRRPPRVAEGRPSIGTAIGEGLRYVLTSPIRAVALRSLLFGFAGSAIWALTPLISRDLLHSGASLYGFLLGAFGAGAIAGAMVNRQFRARLSLNALVRAALALFSLGVVTVAFSRFAPLSLLATFVCGACWVTVVSTLNMSVQMAAASRMVARALSFYQTAIYAGMAAGSWTWGLVAERYGLPAAFLGSAAALAGIILTMRREALPEFAPARPVGAQRLSANPRTPALQEPETLSPAA